MSRPNALALMLMLAGCASPMATAPACVSDEQCGSGRLCFAEGCGDPLTGIVIEVSGNGVGGQFDRDFAIDDGTLGAIKDLDVGVPLRLLCEFQQDLAYTAPVQVQAVGQSELIPNVSRVFETRVDDPVRGTFQMPVGAGVFRVTAMPLDTAVPPVTVADAGVRSGTAAPTVVFAFPTVDQAITLSGRLLKTVDTTKFPAVEVALTATGSAMDLQAFDPDTKDPLSQRFPVSSGQPGANGNFTITLNPRARELRAVLLVATPRDGSQPLPTRTFTISTPLPTAVTLELGDTGEPIVVTGQAVTAAGGPVAGAQVLLTGPVLGGGSFRSKLVTTDAAGGFTLQVLKGSGPMSLTVIPPPESPAAVTSFSVRTPDADGPLSPGTLPCYERGTLTGQVLLPDGAPAAGVVVRASEQRSLGTNGRQLPLEEATTTTDGFGNFELRLDVADWRLEFNALDLPMASRLVSVSAATTQALAAPVELRRGRVVTGVVTGTTAVKAQSPISWASLRFFRVSRGAAPTAILLGTAIADEKGSYSVNLPR